VGDQLETLIVRTLAHRHYDYSLTIRSFSEDTGIPFSAIRRAVYRLEREGVVRVLRLSNQYVVRLRSVERAWELGYLDTSYVTYGAGYFAPFTGYRRGFYLSDEAYITLPFRIRRHETLTRLIDLEIKSRADMEPALAWIGEWPRFTLLFYRATLQPVDKRWEEALRQQGIEPTQWFSPAYGFFAFLMYAVRKLTGADWKEAYCKALELVRDYVQETRAGTSPTEEFVDKVLAEMSKWPCTK